MERFCDGRRKNIMSYAAGPKNPPKGYGSIEAGLTVMEYRSERVKYWAKKIGGGLYTDEVFKKAHDETIAKFGEPF